MGFPEELKQRKIWVCWRIEPSKDKDKDKDRKVPYNPATGKPAQSNAPATWGTYEQAADACERFTYSGLGYMFEEGSGIVGVDIDHCYDKDTKRFNEVAQAVMQKQPTYMEFSPSGTGIHLLYRGTKPDGACKNSDTGVEMYDSKRYFTMTGNQVAGTPDEIADDAGTLQWIHSTYIQKPKQKNTEPKKTKKKAHIVGEPLTDEEVIEKACGAADNGLFAALYDGKWEDKYGSQSEADMALCIKLAFWTAKNKEQMDRLFRSSRLFRPKWDESHRSDGTTYGEETLSKAIEAQESVYTPQEDVMERLLFAKAGR